MDRMKHIKLLLSFVLLIIPIQTKALLCSNENKVKFQTLASNITTSYTYIEENGTVSFQVVLSNITEGLIVKDIKNGVTYPYRGSEIVIPNLSQDTSYRFDIYTSDIDCHLENLYSHYITTPPYNPYYQDAVCIGMENYPICQKWTKVNLTYEAFQQKVESLKQKDEKPIPTPEEEEVTKGIYDYLLEFYLDYYYIVLPVFIAGGIFIIYRYNKKNDLF